MIKYIFIFIAYYFNYINIFNEKIIKFFYNRIKLENIS